MDKALGKLRAENPDYKVIGLCPDLQNPEEVAKAIEVTKETSGTLAAPSTERISPVT